MVAGEVELQLGVARVFAVGEAADDVVERTQRQLGRFLVAADIDDLHVVADRLQVIRVGDVAVARMQLDEAVGGDDRIVVLAVLVIGE